MKRATDLLNRFVFIVITIMILAVFYEGMAYERYFAVGVLITIVDYLILFAGIIKLFTERKTKWKWMNLISTLVIVILFVLFLLSVDYPLVIHVAGYISIWMIYGLQVFDRIKEGYVQANE